VPVRVGDGQQDGSPTGPVEVLDKVGFDPRPEYVEDYWLGILGPSSTSWVPIAVAL